MRFWAGLAVVGALGAGSTAAFGGGSGYTVRTGDTATGIAGRFGITVGDLVAANHLANADLIFVGEHLAIPSGRSGSAHAPSTFPARLLAHPDRVALLPSFRHWAPAAGVPTGLLEALAWMESGWQRNVVSSTGAIGIGQLEPSTVRFVSSQLLGLGYTLNPRNPDANIRMSAVYLGWLLRQTGGSISKAIGSYYQGLVSMRSRGPMLATRIYVIVIRELYRQFGAG